jgi:hypothetical protein
VSRFHSVKQAIKLGPKLSHELALVYEKQALYRKPYFASGQNFPTDCPEAALNRISIDSVNRLTRGRVIDANGT